MKELREMAFMKQILDKMSVSLSKIGKLWEEAEILSSLKHPNVVRFFKVLLASFLIGMSGLAVGN